MANHANFYTVGSVLMAPSATAVLQVDSEDFAEFQLVAEYTYGATASTTGLSCNVTDGSGPCDPTQVRFWFNTTPSVTIHYDSAGSTQTMNPLKISQGTVQTADTRINVDLSTKGQWLKFTFINLDSTNGCTLALTADAS